MWELYVTTFSVLFLIWQNYAINSLNAAKHFFKSNLFLNISNLIKTVVLFAFIPLKMISVGSVIFTFGILGPAIFFFLLFFDKKYVFQQIIRAAVDKREFRFTYTLTFFVASQFFNLALRMDLFLLSFFFSKSPEVGYYGLAQKIILTIIASLVSITQVLSPNFSRIKTKLEIFKELRHGLLYLLIPAALFVVLFFTPGWVFNLFFTENFSQTASITRALSLPFIIYVFMNLPMLFLLYTVKKPAVILVANLAVFIIVSVGCYFLIPRFGVFGPPWAIAGAFLVNLLILSFSAYKEYKKI